MAKQIQKGKEKDFKRLTVEQLRKYPGCENLSDEKAKQIIDSIIEFCFILINRRQENYD